MTIVELLLSIILISIVLMLIIQLCLRARNTYLNSSINVQYELSKSIIIDAVMSDLIKKDISSINRDGNSILFNYEDGTIKTLSISPSDDVYLIKYSGGDDPVIAREYKQGEVEYNGINEYSINYGDNALKEYRIMLNGTDGYDYTINLYCPY